jgi:hypothetical protein
MTEVRRLQDDILSIQRAAGSAAAETRRVEMDGNTEIQRLQESVENLSDELEVLRGSTVERQVSSQILADVRVMMEGSEREQAERLEGVEQLGRSLARRVEGCEANFHSSMAKFQERMSTIEGRLRGDELCSGGKVMVQGLELRHDLNGKTGKLGAYDSDRGRWAVKVPGYGSDGEKIWARAANLFSVREVWRGG